jgi:hypothetical protein
MYKEGLNNQFDVERKKSTILTSKMELYHQKWMIRNKLMKISSLKSMDYKILRTKKSNFLNLYYFIFVISFIIIFFIFYFYLKKK